MHDRVTTQTDTPPEAILTIHPATTMGTVRLTVRDLARSQQFYERALGLVSRDGEPGTVSLSAPGGPPLLELRGDPSAPALDPRAPGLYHLAILYPTRRELAFALARLSAARWPLDGASDHRVSEALYLSDPDGNGIELYRDRPREEWPQEDGQLAMATLPLDLGDLTSELAGATEGPAQVPDGTTIGHVHLQVSDLERAERFYNGVLGFDVTVRGYPGALFVSAGGYHHHIGMNTWRSAGASPPPSGSVGLRSFEIVVPDAAELDRVRGRIEAAGIPVDVSPKATLTRDPSGNQVALRAA